jgi:hypothetical protein
VTTTPTSIPFGTLAFNTDYEAGYRLSINTNATEGYSVLMYADQQLLNAYGSPITPVTGTNLLPLSWSSGCGSSNPGCFGYHVGDDVLSGTTTERRLRFAANDTFAQLATSTPQEVMYSSIPTTETHDIVYKARITPLQQAGDYETTITYVAVPVH